MNKKILLGLSLSFLLISSIGAQNAKNSPAPINPATIVLEFFDDDKQLKIYNNEGFEYGSIYLGMELSPGDRIKTAKSSVELRMLPSNSIIKVSVNTNFQIKALKAPGGGVSEFALLEGKIRAVAAKSTTGIAYRFNTPTAVGGVRGTDFGIDVSPGKRDQLVVREGLVDFTDVKSGKTLNLGNGMAADTFAAAFEARNLTVQNMADFFSDLNFVVLNPGQVPGQQAQPSASPSVKPSVSPSPSAPSSPVPSTSPSPTSAASASPAPNTQPSPSASPAAQANNGVPMIPGDPNTGKVEDGQKITDNKPNPALEAIKKVLGVEIGTITINQITYGKLIAQPKIIVPGFKAVFYLPIIYQKDLFNAADWYTNGGNNEWSFGTDQGTGNVGPIIYDILHDLVLKIKYIEIAKAGDPFFLKIGNVPSMTLGHGFLINEYANDGDFPATRRLGVNLGVDGGNVAFETLVNDLAQPEIFGMRFLWRPAYPSFKLGTGVSLAADINPVGGLGSVGATAQQTTDIALAKSVSPMIFNLGFDLDLPIVESDAFSIKAFGDFGGMIPYFTNGFNRLDSTTVSPGFQLAHFLTLNSSPSVGIGFRNYGIQAGFMGNIAFFSYRIEYQYFDGAFQPFYYDQPYDRTRGQRAIDLLKQYIDPSSSEEGIIKMGIFAKVGANILDTAFVKLGYKWPWTISYLGGIDYSNPDYFTFSLEFAKDKLPYGITFGVSYDRTNFLSLFTDSGNFNIFDQFAVVKGSIEVPIGGFFSLRLAIGTAVKRNSGGAIDMSAGHPVMAPTVIIESVF